MCLTSLGELSRLQGDFAAAAHFYQQSLAISRQTGNTFSTSVVLFNLGEVAAAQDDPTNAARYHQESLAISREFGVPWLIALNMGGLGHAAAATGDVTAAWSYFRQTLSEAQAIGSPAALLYALVGFARLKARAGDHIHGAEWLGLVLGHPSRETDVLTRARTLLSELRGTLPADELDAALERGKALDLETVVRGILDEHGYP